MSRPVSQGALAGSIKTTRQSKANQLSICSKNQILEKEIREGGRDGGREEERISEDTD